MQAIPYLDLGCGFGAYSGALAREGVKCVGCDINIDYLKKAARHGLPVVNVDSALPFRDRSFDSVLIFEVLEHVVRHRQSSAVKPFEWLARMC